MEDLSSRIRCPKLMDKIMTAEQAAAEIKDGMIIGTSGFTPAGYPKAIPLALAERVKKSGEHLKVTIFSGASLGEERLGTQMNPRTLLIGFLLYLVFLYIFHIFVPPKRQPEENRFDAVLLCCHL